MKTTIILFLLSIFLSFGPIQGCSEKKNGQGHDTVNALDDAPTDGLTDISVKDMADTYSAGDNDVIDTLFLSDTEGAPDIPQDGSIIDITNDVIEETHADGKTDAGPIKCPIVINEAFGGNGMESAFDIALDGVGGYAVAGHTSSKGAGKNDLWILGLDEAGALTWDKIFGGKGDEVAFSIRGISDTGYVVSGYSDSFGQGKDAYVIRMDHQGNVQWEKSFGGSGEEEARDAVPKRSGGFLFTGYTSSYGHGSDDLWIVALTDGGDVDWEKVYGGGSLDRGYAVRQTADDGFILVGETYSFGEGKGDAYILKTNGAGEKVWEKTYGGSEEDGAVDVRELSDGGYIVVGTTASKGSGKKDIWVIRLDASGEKIWDKVFGEGESDRGHAVSLTSDGGFIVAGDSEYVLLYTQRNMRLIRLDADGGTLFDYQFGGAYSETGDAVLETEPGSYIATGLTEAQGAGNFDIWVLKIKCQ